MAGKAGSDCDEGVHAVFLSGAALSGAVGPFLVRLAYGDDGTPAGHFPADAAAPQLSVLDLAATRGDGIFETISLGNGHLQALEPHLARFAHSASMLDLPVPDAAQWRAAITEVAAHLDAAAGAPVDEGFVKIVMSRGVEGGSESDCEIGAVSAEQMQEAARKYLPANKDGYVRVVLRGR